MLGKVPIGLPKKYLRDCWC